MGNGCGWVDFGAENRYWAYISIINDVFLMDDRTHEGKSDRRWAES